jgi:hypothetical protein
MRIDIMVDLETLGTETDSTIIQIAAIAFDMETKEEKETFNEIADISKNPEVRITADTLKWWLRTDKELFTKMLHSGNNSSYFILSQFYNWLDKLVKKYGQKNVYLWGNGILFDNKMIQMQMKNNYMEYPIFYRNDRDVRTLVDIYCKQQDIPEEDLKGSFNDINLTKHDALDDVRYQIKLVHFCYNRLIDKNN